MREILFRGKQKKNGKWIYGDLYQNFQVEGEHCIPTGSGIAPVITETVGQYTGLLDKNGTKIFEGDIIQNKGSRFVIEYEDGIAGFIARSKSNIDWTPCVNRGTMKSYEVIGNIHDNPELLKGGVLRE